MSRNGITGRSNFVNSLSSPAMASRSPSSCVSFGLDSGGVRKSVQGGLCIPAPKLPLILRCAKNIRLSNCGFR